MRSRNTDELESGHPARWVGGHIAHLILLLTILLIVPRGGYAEGRLPEGMANLPAAQAVPEWKGVLVGNIRDDGDLPVLLMVDPQGQAPAILIGLDARNGTEEYSLLTDPALFVAVLTDVGSIATLYYDVGYAVRGTPSGEFREIAHPAPDDLPPFVRSIVPLDAPRPAGRTEAPRFF